MIEDKNIFTCALSLGKVNEIFIILAENLSDAVDTLDIYLLNYEIIYLLPLEKITDITQQLKQRDENFHLVCETKVIQEKTVILEYNEWGLNKESIEIKYKEKNILILNKEDIINLYEKVVEDLEINQNILISPKVLL